MWRRLRARLVRAAALVAVMLAVVVARVVWSSHGELDAAEARAAAGDVIGAVDHYGRAARLWVPGSPLSARALDRLEDIATRAERAADRPTALAAWREVRASILAVRGLWTPSRERLARADARIAALAAASEGDRWGTLEARTRWHAERLARTDAPSVGWTLAALFGLAAWIACALGLLVRAVDDDERLRRASALAWSLGILAGMALFMIGLRLA
jgi:type II secretory pathway pseudopilin PulG